MCPVVLLSRPLPSGPPAPMHGLAHHLMAFSRELQLRQMCPNTVPQVTLKAQGCRRKNMSRPCLLSRHHDTTTSPSFCPHHQLPDLLYTLSSNCLQEKILSPSRDSFLSPPHRTLPSNVDVLCGDKFSPLWPEWQVHWLVAWGNVVKESHAGLWSAIDMLILLVNCFKQLV